MSRSVSYEDLDEGPLAANLVVVVVLVREIKNIAWQVRNINQL